MKIYFFVKLKTTIQIFFLFLFLTFFSARSSALSKGIAEINPLPPPFETKLSSEPLKPDAYYVPPSAPVISSEAELAEAVGTQFGRVAYSWAEGTSLPFLGAVVRGVVRMSRSAMDTKSNMEDKYGVSMHSYGSNGVSVMYRRKF